MRAGEISSLSEIAGGSLVKPVVTARDVHSAVGGRVFGILGPLASPTKLIQDRISRVTYRAVALALRAPVRAGGRLIAEQAGANGAGLADSTAGSLALGVLNGIAGDRLARDHSDLALELTVRTCGRDVSLDTEGLAAAFPDAASRLAVFVHGLCETDAAWRLGAPGEHPPRTYGDRLREELDYTPVYVRYNTGLHVSDNGRRLAETLAVLSTEWPVRVEEIALVGHSMGGLVGRSACYYGEQQGHGWTDRLRHVFCLGTPHLGAPLERAANVAGWALSRAPEARPFADLLLNGRSAGIKDLRFGNCIEEDWQGYDADEFLRDRCCEVPFLPSATYYFIGATITRRPGGFGGLIGDLLVHYPSASGAGRKRRIPFELENGRHVGGAHHLQLLNHPAVYAQIRDWLERAKPRES